MAKWKTKKENLQFENWRLKVYQNEVIRPDGKELSLTRLDFKPGAHFVGLTDDKKIPLIKQYRYPADDYFLEVPSGGVDVDKESFESAAIREFIEETGFVPRNVQFVARYFHSASLNFPYEIYFSNDLISGNTNFEDSEFGSEVILLTYEECMERVRSGEIHDSSALACLAVCHEKGLI